MRWVSCVTKMKNNLKVEGGLGGLYNPEDVRVADGAFVDLGFESEKKWGFVQVLRHSCLIIIITTRRSSDSIGFSVWIPPPTLSMIYHLLAGATG